MATAARTPHRFDRPIRTRDLHRPHPQRPRRDPAQLTTRVPDPLLNHDPQRARPSDFHPGCVE